MLGLRPAGCQWMSMSAAVLRSLRAEPVILSFFCEAFVHGVCKVSLIPMSKRRARRPVGQYGRDLRASEAGRCFLLYCLNGS